MPEENVNYRIAVDEVLRENKLEPELTTALFLPMAKMRRSGDLKRIVAWYMKVVRLLAERLDSAHPYPENVTEEQVVAAIAADPKGSEELVQQIRSGIAGAVLRARQAGNRFYPSR